MDELLAIAWYQQNPLQKQVLFVTFNAGYFACWWTNLHWIVYYWWHAILYAGYSARYSHQAQYWLAIIQPQAICWHYYAGYAGELCRLFMLEFHAIPPSNGSKLLSNKELLSWSVAWYWHLALESALLICSLCCELAKELAVAIIGYFLMNSKQS